MKKIYSRVWTEEGCHDLTEEEAHDNERKKLYSHGDIKIQFTNGTKKWLVNGNLHRLNGPAIIWHDDIKEWWINGKRHRLDGPAVEEPDGTKEWCVNGEFLPTDEVETWLKENKINLKTPEGQLALKLRWS